MFFFQPWALTNGGTLLNADWSKSTLASPQTIEAAAFAQSLCLKGYSPKPGGAFDDVVEFVDNKLAIFGCGMWLNPGIVAAKAAGKVKIVAWPQKVQKGTSVGWNAYPITKSSKNKEAAWAFLKYVASTRAVVNLTATAQATPGRKSVFFADLHKAAPEQGINEFWNQVGLRHTRAVARRLGRRQCGDHQDRHTAVLVERRPQDPHDGPRQAGKRVPQQQRSGGHQLRPNKKTAPTPRS